MVCTLDFWMTFTSRFIEHSLSLFEIEMLLKAIELNLMLDFEV